MSDTIINLQFTTLTTTLPDFVWEGLKEYCRNANGYRPQPQILIDRLATKLNFPKEMIGLTAGADEAINAFALGYGKSAYIFTPTYIVYAGMKDFYAQVTAINALQNGDYSIPTQTIPNATLILLANPNNPCGFTPKEKVIELIKNNQHALVVIDEVYAEFAHLSVIEETKKYSNLAVIRSFSKSYGMAGARIGYVVSNPDILQMIRNKTQWANVSYLSVGAAMTALDHETYFKNIIANIISERNSFIVFLKNLGFTILPSNINAVLIQFQTREEGTKFAKHLLAHKCIISHGNGHSNVGLDERFVRISIGTKEEMHAVKDIIKQFTAK